MSPILHRNLSWTAAVLAAFAAAWAPWPILSIPGAVMLVTVMPGVAVARWLGMRMDWRDARTWAVVLGGGLALSPLVIFSIAWVVPYNPQNHAAILAILSGGLNLTARPCLEPVAPRISISRRALLLMAAALVVAAVALVPLRTVVRDSILPLNGAYRATDWVKHYGVAWQIEATGLPPLNLLVGEDPPRTHHYYLFYHLTVAVLDQLTRSVLGLGIWLVVVALAVMAACLLAVYSLAFSLWKSERAAFVALLCTTLLGGLDVLPSLEGFVRGEAGSSPWFQVDAWDVGWSEVSTFLTAFTNVPQHQLALALLLVVWLIVISVPPSWRLGLMVGLIIVSAAGHSFYVVFAAMPGAALAVAASFVRALRANGVSETWRAARPWLAAALAVPVAVPLLAFLAQSGAADGGLPLALWVRTEGVNVYRLSTGTPVQALFRDGGAIAQLLDLPLYLLIELGAAGALAVLALVCWRGALWRGAWLLGSLAATSSFLVGVFVRSTLGWNDLGIRGMLPFQAVTAIWAGGGWLALISSRSAVAPRQTLVVKWHWLALCALVVLASLIVGYQRPWSYTYDLLIDDGVPRPVTGMYAIETDNGTKYRWSGPEVSVPLDGAAVNTSYVVRVSASAGSRPPRAPAAEVIAALEGTEIGRFTLTAEQQQYPLTLGAEAIRGRNAAALRLRVPAWRPADFGSADRRDLGLLLDFVHIEPAPGNPLLLPPADLVVAAITLGMALGAWSRRRIGLIAGAGGVMIGALAFRPWMALALPYIALAVGAGIVVRHTAAALAHWLSGAAPRRHAKLVVSLLAFGGALTTAWQIAAFDVAKFLPAWDAAAARVDARSLAYGDALRYVREHTPRTAMLQVDPALQGVGMGWSVTAERRSRLFLDEVFLYQLKPEERTRRRGLVEAAFAAPESAVVCDRMRSLRLDMILVEKASGHPWLDDRDTPDGCMRTLYENEILAVLSIQ